MKATPPMHIANVMFGRGRGGIEQAALDYAQALNLRGHHVTTLLHPNSAMTEAFAQAVLSHMHFSNIAEWDIFAVRRLKNWLTQEKPDAIICHGNRAIGLMRKATKTIPVIGVAHNYKLKRFHMLDGACAITRDLLEEIIDQGLPRERVFYVPNMIRADSMNTPHARHTPPVIGSMGRMVKKKGFDYFIEALVLLKQEGVSFRARLGGDGEEKSALEALALKHGLTEYLEFTGWVEDKHAFLESIDIFCLPSLHEPFGIVLLEAFNQHLPIVTTDAEGPSDIIRPDVEALMVPKADALAMADALRRLLEDEALGRKLAMNAHDKLLARFDMTTVSLQIENALTQLIGQTRSDG